MSAEYDRLEKVYREAKRLYDDAERALASARFTLNYAERARSAEWDKLVLAAAALPRELEIKMPREQFGPALLQAERK